LRHRRTVVGMTTIISAFISLLSFRFRSRAGLELELVALRHQVAVLRRQRKGRIQLFSTDRLLWVVSEVVLYLDQLIIC
jgi:putative transposase